VGIAIGVPAAFATTRWIPGQLYGLKTNDPRTIAAAVLIPAAVSRFIPPGFPLIGVPHIVRIKLNMSF